MDEEIRDKQGIKDKGQEQDEDKEEDKEQEKEEEKKGEEDKKYYVIEEEQKNAGEDMNERLLRLRLKINEGR